MHIEYSPSALEDSYTGHQRTELQTAFRALHEAVLVREVCSIISSDKNLLYVDIILLAAEGGSHLRRRTQKWGFLGVSSRRLFSEQSLLGKEGTSSFCSMLHTFEK